MSKPLSIVLSALLLLSTAPTVWAEEAPQKIRDLAQNQLAAYGKEAVIVEAVKAENAKGRTLAQIKDLDAKWMATPGLNADMKALMESPCGKFLVDLQKSSPYFLEIFVMDNQGANVAMTDKTSDYWQGDEAKFQKAFNGGAGAVFIDAVKFDESAQAYLVQVSVPVMDGDQAIGAITIGIDVDKVP